MHHLSGLASPVAIGTLIAVAAIAHATWNLTIKRAGTSGAGFLWLTFLVGVLVFLPFGIWSLVDSGANLWHWAGLASVSGVLQVGYFLLLQRGYRAGDVSVVYPLARGTGPLLSVIFAIILLGERPGWLALVGVAVVVAGVVTIGMAGWTGAGSRGAAAPTRSNRAGILYGLAIGVMIAAYTLWDASAVTIGAMPAVGLYWGSVVVQTLVLAPFAAREPLRATARKHWPAVLIVGVLAPLAYMLVLLAIQQSSVSLVAPAREVSVVLVGLAGWLLFREPHPAQRLVGAGLVLCGIVLLAVG